MHTATNSVYRFVTADELMAMEFPDETAGELVTSGQCHPFCLMAQGDPKECDCTCGGMFHGALFDAVVSEVPKVRALPDRNKAEDLAILASLQPKAKSIRDARKRLGWNNARTMLTMRMYRDAFNAEAAAAEDTPRELIEAAKATARAAIRKASE